MAKVHNLHFLRKDEISQNTWSFFFDRSKTDFDFLPGQYVRMTLPHGNADDRGTTRYFTIASSPTREGEIMITTRVIESTFKRKLFALIPGQEIEFFGPMGKFVLDAKDETPKVFLAGGIGLTPFHSMLTFASEKKLSTPLTLFVSFRKMHHIVFQSELVRIAKNNPNIQVVYTLSGPERSDPKWQGETGRITAAMIEKYVPDIQQAMFFSTGPIVFTDAMRTLLINAGISEEQIRKEEFAGY